MGNALTARKKLLVFGISFLIFLNIVYANIRINEVMANPNDEDYDEWLEIYNNGSDNVNLSNYAISDSSWDCDSFLFGYQGKVIPAYSYGIITDQFSYVYYDYNVSESALRIRVEDSAMGNGLNNNGDEIKLFNDTDCINLIDNFSYTNSSNEKSFALMNGIWQETVNATPGYSNVISNPCDPSVDILLNKYTYSNEETIYFTPKVSGVSDYKIEYWIEDLFGGIIKNVVDTTNSNQKQYTPSIDEEDKVLIIIANLTYSSCDDINKNNNYINKTVGIRGISLNDEPSLKIYKIYDLGTDDKAKFGQIIKVKINAYKGNSSKEAIELWVENGEKISKITKFNVYDEYTNYTLTLPIQLFANCNGEYEDGKYNIIAEGLDKKDSIELDIEDITNSLCEEIEVDNSKESDFEVLESPNEAIAGYDFFTKVNIKNNENNNQKFQVWSYVYKGKKIYGTREENMQEISLPKNSEMIVELKNNAVNVEEGDYKLKINVKKGDKKTASSVTKSIKFYEEAFESIGYVAASKDNFESIKNDENFKEEVSGNVVYESKDIKERRIAVYFFCLLLVLMLVYVLVKKDG